MKFQRATSSSEIPAPVFWLVVAAAVVLAGEVALASYWLWLGVAAIATGALALAAPRIGGAGRWSVAVGLGVLALTEGVAAARLAHIERDTATFQAEAIRDAALERDALLRAAVAAASRTADLALERVSKANPEEVPELGDMVANAPVERAVAVLDSRHVIALAGPHRFRPDTGRGPAFLVSTPFARLLVIRLSRAGREAQVTLLLDAAPGLPVAGPSLASEVGGWRGIGWTWNLPAGDPLRFPSPEAAIAGVSRAMLPVMPELDAFVTREAEVARWLVGGGLLFLTLAILVGSRSPALRAGALLVPLWALVRSGIATGPLSLTLFKGLLGALVLLLIALVFWRRPARRTVPGLIIAIILLASTPLLLSWLAQAVVPDIDTGSIGIWFCWQVVIALLGMGYLAIATAPLRATANAMAPPGWGIAATAAVALVGIGGIVAWTPGGWEEWYLPLWLIPLVLLLPATTTRARLVSLAITASVLAALVTWSASLERRMELAHADLDRLGASSDSTASRALDAFAQTATTAHATRLDRLYAAWRASSLARAGVPTYLALWRADGHQREVVALDSLNISYDELAPIVSSTNGAPRHVSLARGAGHHEVLVLPLAPDTLATITIGPRSLLFAPTTFGLLTGWRTPRDAPYRVDVIPAQTTPPDGLFHRWHRFVREVRVVRAGEVPQTVQAEIEISPPRQFAVRALLVVFLDIGIILGVWFLLRGLLSAEQREGAPVFRRSYRRTVATSLAAFFIVPATMFTLWSLLRLRQDATTQRSAELAETLRDVAVEGGFALAEAPHPSVDSLAAIADIVNGELGVYRRGRLIASSTPMLEEMGILPPVLDPAFALPTGAEEKTLGLPLPNVGARLGVEATAMPNTYVVAALPGSDTDLEREQVDLGLLLLLASLTGGAAAIGVAGPVARALGKPIETLRQTALAIGRHELPPEAGVVPAEFVPVFGALTQMELDLRTSEAELQAGRARTAAILSTVATGVIGLDADGFVIHVNPRAAELLGAPIEPAQRLTDQLSPAWQPVAEGIVRVLDLDTRSAESRELQIGDQRLAVTLAPLGDGGLVLALTDITEASRAARIVAWGEMARQVAHEIKNPLTPMRLGLQHLRRVTADRHVDLPRIVDETAQRLLDEIERLDRIARSFARYGTPPDRQVAPLEPIALRAAAEELAGLFALSGERPRIEVIGESDGPVPARHEELVQVLLNLLDNSRQAGAAHVRMTLSGRTLRVEDDGNGIPPDQLGKIFEPSFSTNTSGTGLGLAIVRRMVEGWGGTIEVESQPQRGAAFTLRFAALS